ncbi:nucleotidyltransferase domain-containing protein [Candidatus Woesearchaeota archaeon]|nr:nucleotidyltransferase domain-containing protein [Candidatus Woesearchaeota archaeon]
MNYKLIAYAEDFISFLLEKLNKESDKIKQIILFGSVARDEDSKNSDIDLFIEIIDKKIENKINEIKEKFYDSVKVKKYWSLLGINNEINCSIGELEEWDELKRSLVMNGIVLYGKYKGSLKTELYYLFVVFPGKNRNKNISGWRKLYGYNQKISKKIYIKEGLIKDYNGKKLARAVFIIPSDNVQKMISFLKKNSFKYEIIPFWKEK